MDFACLERGLMSFVGCVIVGDYREMGMKSRKLSKFMSECLYKQVSG